MKWWGWVLIAAALAAVAGFVYWKRDVIFLDPAAAAAADIEALAVVPAAPALTQAEQDLAVLAAAWAPIIAEIKATPIKHIPYETLMSENGPVPADTATWWREMQWGNNPQGWVMDLA